MKEKNCYKRIIFYCIFFIIIFPFIFFTFIKDGISFVSIGWDGLTQHLLALRYYGRFLRGIVSDFAANHVLSIPLFDMSLGEGNDILMSLHYYVIGDPFTILSFFFSEENAIYCYQLIVILKLFLTGLSFTILCNYKFKDVKYDKMVVLCSLLYAYNLFNLSIAMLGHPFFLNPLIYLPLLILGVDLIFDKTSPFLYIIVLTVTFLSNFYFAYMLSLIVLIYVIYRFFVIKEGKTIFRYFLKFAAFTAISFFMASLVIVPTLYFALSDSRSAGLATPIHPFFSRKMLTKTTNHIFFMYPWDADSLKVGIPIALVPFLVSYFVQAKSKKRLFSLIILFLFFTPIFWKLMCCMNYPSYRWSYVLVFLSLIISVKYGAEFTELEKPVKNKILFIALLIDLILISISLYVQGSFSNILIFNIIISIISTILLFFCNFNLRYFKLSSLIIIISVISTVINIRYMYLADNWYDDYLKFEDKDMKEDSVYATARFFKKDSKDFFRLSGSNLDWDRNGNLLYGVSSTQYYWSMVNPSISRFRNALGLTDKMPWLIIDNDKMTILDELSAVKYIADNRYPNPLPSSYKSFPAFNNNLFFYENESALPLVYYYGDFIPEDETLKLNLAEKEHLMLNTAIINVDNNIKTNSFPINKINTTPVLSIDYDITVPEEYTDSVKLDYDHNKIFVYSDNGEIILSYNGIDNSEIYFQFKGLNCYNIKDQGLTDSYEDIDTLYGFTVFDEDEPQKHIKCFSDYDSKGRGGIKDYSVNLSYKEKREGKQNVKVFFDQPGIYTYDDILLSYYSFDHYAESIDELKTISLENFYQGVNRWTFDIDSKESGLACIAIPYSKGFTAFVNSEKTPIYNTNYKYQSVVIPSGKSTIELTYERPFNKLCIALTILGLICFLSIFLHKFIHFKSNRS